MRVNRVGCWLLLALFAARAPAVFDDLSDPAANVQLKADADAQAPRPESLLLREEERQEAARLRAEKIRNLPPEKVQEWVSGRLTEEELGRMAPPAAGAQETASPELEVAVPRERALRLALAGALVLALAAALWRSRRRQGPAAR